MFRVPNDPDNPTFDDTFKVGFWRWLFSGSTEGKEWARRRNAAAQLALKNQLARGEEAGEQWRAQWDDAKQIMRDDKEAKKAERQAKKA